MTQEEEWDQEFLIILFFIVFGVLIMILAMHNTNRNSDSYKSKMGLFILYESVLFIIYTCFYFNGLYIQHKDSFYR